MAILTREDSINFSLLLARPDIEVTSHDTTQLNRRPKSIFRVHRLQVTIETLSVGTETSFIQERQVLHDADPLQGLNGIQRPSSTPQVLAMFVSLVSFTQNMS